MKKELIKNNGTDKPVDTGQVLKFEEDRQKKIWHALAGLDKECGPYLASMYEGIVLSFQDNNPEKVSIICHLAREISSTLPAYVNVIPQKRIDFPPERIIKELNNIVELLDASEDKSENDRKIRDIVKNLSNHFQNELAQINTIRSVIDNHPILSIRAGYINEAFIKQWITVHQYFVKNAHHGGLRKKEAPSHSIIELEDNWRKFEGLLFRVLVEEPFFNPIKEIDRLLIIPHPVERDADELIRLIVEDEHRRYFYDKCDNPDWLALLNERKAFASPQKPIKQDEYIQFVLWPESKYLARIANQKPEEVYQIIKNLKSENRSVLDDFIDAAMQSPAKIAALYIELIKNGGWINDSNNLRLSYKIADLIEKLTLEGEPDSAILLVDEILNLHIKEPIQADSDTDMRFLPRPDAKPYFDEWHYGQIIQKKNKELTLKKPVELFDIYVNKLHTAIRLERRDNESDNFYEYSHIWRPNLSHARNTHEDAKNILLDGIINLIAQYKDNIDSIKRFFDILGGHDPAIFRRLEMFIIDLQSDSFIVEVEAILRNKNIIVAYNLRREYLPLLGKCFDKISREAKKEILDAIVDGPNLQKGEDWSQEEFDHTCAHWRGLYFAPIEKHLYGKYKKVYQDIVEKYGESQDDDGEIKTWDGGKSPISAEGLAVLNAVEVVEYLENYIESDDPFSEYSAGGLGLVYCGVVAEYPEKYVASINLLFDKKVRPVFIYQFFHGLKDALRKGKCFDWRLVVSFCSKIVNSEISVLAEPASRREQDWRSVRGAIADLLGEALGGSHCEIPIEFRKQVWGILSLLVLDDNPSKEDEERDGAHELDPMSLAINSVRGETMHAIISYGLWVIRNNKKLLKDGIKMPVEMYSILNDHLDISKDSSLAIRSVYGWRLPNLFFLDRDWVIANLHLILPSDPEQQLFFTAALEGYLSNSVYDDVFDALKPVYKNAITLLGINSNKAGYRAADIDERLPQHLMVTYIHHSQHDDLIEYFFANAPAKARGEAINFIGSVVLKELSELSDREYVIERIKKLWDKRILGEDKKDIEEIQEFGWWFKRSPFSRKETIDSILNTLKASGGVIDVVYDVVEGFQDYASEFPIETIDSLSLIAHAEKYYTYSYEEESCREVIKKVKATGNEEAIKRANELINFFGSKGFIGFRDLL